MQHILVLGALVCQAFVLILTIEQISWSFSFRTHWIILIDFCSVSQSGMKVADIHAPCVPAHLVNLAL